MQIREFRFGDEIALHDVFRSAVRLIASRDYTAEQIDAWAPETIDLEAWIDRMRALQPYVVEDEGRIVGYADLQTNGYIDHFYVSGSHPRRGIGAMLMRRIHDVAESRRIGTLTSDVSRTAQPFFERFGFVVVEHRMPVLGGVGVPNAFMRKDMPSRRGT